MRKITMLNRISLDGYYAGLNGEIDWFIHDPEVDKAAHEMIQPDTILFGRLTYQMFEAYWPPVAQDVEAAPEARRTADELNRMTKVVFSRTLADVTWANSVLIEDDPVTHLAALRQQAGGDFTIFGSGSLVRQLANAGLIDAYLVIVTPVVLGVGKPLFEGIARSSLKLVDTRNFRSGNVLLYYESAQPEEN